MPTRIEAIKRFLTASTVKDLADLYNGNMECQVNVAQDEGERVDGEFKGRRWHGWTDGLTTWKSFRIPWKANTDPEYTDCECGFDLVEHTEAIGMTGWDWYNQCSEWVAFDFDAMIGHATSHTSILSNEELESVQHAACDLDWVTVRHSTSGAGLHLYVILPSVPTKTHTEHAALARSILGLMSAMTGFDFSSKVDAVGGNMWVWHRKMRGTKGLQIIKSGGILKAIPPNWKDHINVIKGSARKTIPNAIDSPRDVSLFDDLIGQRSRTPLDETHRSLFEFLEDTGGAWWWDSSSHLLCTHTSLLQRAHTELGYRGYFRTCSDATDLNEQNCFAFPMRGGAWSVRRFTPGVAEDVSWTQDGAGWTITYLNRDPDISTACRAFGGLEDVKGGFIFREAELAIKAAELMGASIDIGTPLRGRKAHLKLHKDGRLICEIAHDPNDSADEAKGFLFKKDVWVRIYTTANQQQQEPEIGTHDDLLRHLVSTGEEDGGWVIAADGVWRTEPLAHVRVALGAMGMSGKEVVQLLGSSVFKCWKLVNKPFQPEYPGDREWNRNAAQYRFLPSNPENQLSYPSWQSILQHVGCGLDDTIRLHPWCKANGIQNGADYIKCWIASLFQFPLEPLPYLFLYGPQNSGKSILHEALSLLITKGYQRADASLSDRTDFNGELEGAIICVVEETDLKRNKTAYNRIKDWVTSRELLVHHKNRTPYHIPNSTHWIQCSNEHNACPIFPGDSRITMCFVDSLEPSELIPKRHFIKTLEKEAPDFLANILALEVPESNDRLMVPVLETADKRQIQQTNQTQLELFLSSECKTCIGATLKFSDFYDSLIKWMDPQEIINWSKIKVGRHLPPQYPRGRMRKTGQFYIGNVIWKDSDCPPGIRVVLRGEYLEPESV